MAADETGNDVNMNPHVQDYSLFTGLMKWGTILTVITVAIVVFIIAA